MDLAAIEVWWGAELATEAVRMASGFEFVIVVFLVFGFLFKAFEVDPATRALTLLLVLSFPAAIG